MYKILVVDDEPKIREVIKEYGEFSGYEITEADDGITAVGLCKLNDYDLIIMDIMMPKLDGFSACKEIKKIKDIPVIMLSARGEEYDKLFGFELGIDDYVVKPYRPAALLARIDRALARSGSADSARGQIDHGGVSLDSVRAVVSYRGKRVELSRNELLILRILMENAGSIISRSELMDELWQTDAFVDDNTLTVNVNRLRRSLESAGVPDDFITTRRGLGYVVR